jgi:hypothetical protein
MTTPRRPAISSPERSGVTPVSRTGGAASQPTRQASRVMMRHSDLASGVGGTMDATEGSAVRCAGRQLPLPTVTTVTSPSVRQAFRCTNCWTPAAHERQAPTTSD